MNPFAETKKILRYLIGKRSELEELEIKDVVMAKAILDIHRKRTHKEIVSVPLFSIRQIHTLDRENALQATELRIGTLQANKDELLKAGTLTCGILTRFLPSVSWIKVVRGAADSYLAFEGNGRVAAMQAVFHPSDGVQVEVEQYLFRNPKKIIRRLNRVRKLNGLLDSVA